jgi:hypothetical protein
MQQATKNTQGFIISDRMRIRHEFFEEFTGHRLCDVSKTMVDYRCCRHSWQT